MAIFFCGVVNADTETINWYIDDDTTYATTTCQTGGDITLPNTPTKRGYTFQGWAAFTNLVEYIESSGAQAINTGIRLHADSDIRLVFEYNPNNKNGYIGTNFWLETSMQWLTVGVKNQVVAHWKDGVDNVKVNGVVKRNDRPNNNSENCPVMLFTLGCNTSFSTSGKLYSAQIYDHNILVRDFIPVIDGNDVPCLYDRVEKKFYYNTRNGQFVAGPVLSE